MVDLKRLNSILGMQLEHTQQAFLNVEERIEKQSHAMSSSGALHLGFRPPGLH
jgi:hypothetical protein